MITLCKSNGLAFAEAPSLAVFRSKFLNNYRASLPHNSLEGSGGILNQNHTKYLIKLLIGSHDHMCNE